jgi:acetyl-CoA C-acetyltransferase
MSKVFIVGAKRTAIGTFGGALKEIPANRLGAHVIKAAMQHANVKPDMIDESIMGNVLSAGQGMGPGRQAAIYAGIPVEKAAYSVNILCGSGMKSVMIGSTDIKAGEAQIVAAGGMESMSMAPYMIPSAARFGMKFGNGQIFDHMIVDGLTDVFNNYHMGVTAENIARKYSLSRKEQDDFALASQQKAKQAIESGRFSDEIAPYELKVKKDVVYFAKDEHPRYDTTADSLAKLRPAFLSDGTVTAGNASGINDGASALILASEEAVQKYGLKPLAEIISYAQAGVDPSVMGLGPYPAIKKALEKSGLNLKDIQLLELNEAFAAQSLGVIKELCEAYSLSKEWIMERTNVNGGAIALGHPIGASGNRIIVSLLYEMKKRSLSFGLASLCIGGGMGTAVLIKNL